MHHPFPKWCCKVSVEFSDSCLQLTFGASISEWTIYGIDFIFVLAGNKGVHPHEDFMSAEFDCCEEQRKGRNYTFQVLSIPLVARNLLIEFIAFPSSWQRERPYLLDEDHCLIHFVQDPVTFVVIYKTHKICEIASEMMTILIIIVRVKFTFIPLHQRKKACITKFCLM